MASPSKKSRSWLDRRGHEIILLGEFSRELDEAVKQVKNSEERRAEYKMLLLREMELEAEAEARGREEGREEGEIIGAIKYAHRKGESPSEIISNIMDEFELSKDEAEERVDEVLGLVMA